MPLYARSMKKTARLASLVGLVVLVFCACAGPPVENAERTTKCKDSGNQRMCGVCCNTKSVVFDKGTCACFGDVEK